MNTTDPRLREDDSRSSIILACDSSSPNLTLALWKKGKLTGQKNLLESKHSHLLVHLMAELLKKAKISPAKLDFAAFGFGPGSYTGLRIGLASLKALLLSQSHLRAVKFSSLDLIACGIAKPLFAVIVDARRDKIYCNFYRKEKGALQRLFEKPLLVSPEDLEEKILEFSKEKPVWLTGDALIRYKKTLEKLKNSHFLSSAFWYPKAVNAAALIHHQMKLGAWCDLRKIRPIYMRRSEAEEKWGLCYDERDL